MTPDAADFLAKRIINTWRGGPPITEWREQLTQLDEGQAGTAFARLRGQLDNAPSIARFMSEYRSLHTASADDKCGDCANSGWVPIELPNGDTAWYEHNGQQYTGAKPCRCRHGQTAAASKTWTEATRRRIGPKRITEAA